MDLGDAATMLGAFLGGGVAKTVIDGVLADRHDRRTTLRRRDHVRIDDVRSAAAEMWGIARQEFHKEWPHPPWLLPMERLDRMGQVVEALDDRGASARWWGFVRAAVSLPIMRAIGDDDESRQQGGIGAPKWEAMVLRRYERLSRRLNRLERRR